MKDRWQVRWWRVGVALAICFAGVGLVNLVVFSWWMPLWGAREFYRDHPRISETPAPLTDKSVAKLEGLRVERFEFSFQVPWKEIGWQKNLGSASSVVFKDGQALIVFDPRRALDSAKTIQDSAKTPREAATVRRTFGSSTLSSNYDLMAAELAATPAQGKWWAGPRQNARNFVLLGLKSMEMMDANAIYGISNEEMHGFQLGNPALAPYKVELDLFDRGDRRYKIILTQRDRIGPILTQAEVNAIVASIHPIPHS